MTAVSMVPAGTTGIIMSGTYVEPGLVAEFGRIPPSFLPLGNRRLYTHQVEMMKKHCEIVYIAVPEGFDIPEKDELALLHQNVNILPVDETLSISDALFATITSIVDLDDIFVVLYGDTLFSGLPELPLDFYSAHIAVDEYKWASAPVINGTGEGRVGGLVVSGLFSFSSRPALTAALDDCGGSIIEALRIYNEELPLEMLSDGDWFDFGHPQTYYASCGLITTQRSFNSLKVSRERVDKSSDDYRKMTAEANWFEALPCEMRVFAPTYLGREEVDGQTIGYGTQNTYLSTLANLSTFGKLNENTWSSIFASCKEFLTEAGSVKIPDGESLDLDGYYRPKTDARLKQFSIATGYDISRPITVNDNGAPSPLQMSQETGDLIAAADAPHPTLIHGDFCFSNIFFDFRSRLVKVIDPRGIAPSGEITVFGDPRYDIGKLSHSVLGRYDAIISGDITARMSGRDLTINMDTMNTSSWQQVENAFIDSGLLLNDQDRRVNQAIMVQLFLSMLPLHADHPSRQIAFLANAGRLFLQMEK